MSARAADRMRRLGAQAGFSLIEVLVAWSVLLIGIVGTLHAFAGAQRGTAKAEERAQLTVIAQREIERLRGLPYAKLGLTSLPGAGGEAPRTGPAATEALVEGGTVDPGPTAFDAEGISGRIYRYVTWRAQSCPLLTTKVATKLDTRAGSASGSAEAALVDLCPGSRHTKRVFVAVVADDPYDPGRVLVPLRAQTIVADTTTGVLPNPVGLAVDRSEDVAALGEDVQTAQEALYQDATTQTLYLYDTPCSSATRQTPSSHPARNSARKDDSCSSSEQTPDLMGLGSPPPGPPQDFSDDLVRSPAEGLALKRDDRASGCAADVPYEAADAGTRKWSVHRWSTRPFSREVETLASGGRATLTVFTRSVGGAVGAGRLCVVVRRPGTATPLGFADFALAQWPTAAERIAISLDLEHAVLGPGERLTVIVRNHPDSEHDIELLYDREQTPSALSLTLAAGKEIP